MRRVHAVPRGGLIRWIGPSPTHNYSPSRVDGAQLIPIEKFLGTSLAGFLSGHPCIGARTLAANYGFYYAVYRYMTTVETAVQLLQDCDRYFSISDREDPIVKSFLCVFTDDVRSQQQFSELFWSFAQTVHDVDFLTHNYDPSVSSNPNDDSFEMSFRGRAVFPTTLHNDHPRPSRRFAYPGFALNQSSQFNALREAGEFEKWQRKIRTADSGVDLEGEANPLLADHGVASAAAQLAQLEQTHYPFNARDGADRRKLADDLLRQASSEHASQQTIDYLNRARDKLDQN